ncbi:MAG TPA: hypothetical protein PL033_20885 [Candidatus Brocadiia bacterium]|nr:hypothetical protein [Candidatus Brocadiia bacterium]
MRTAGNVLRIIVAITARIAILSTVVASTLDAAMLSTRSFVLRFSADGHPMSLKMKGDDRELVSTDNPGLGFYLTCRDGAPLRFERLQIEEDKLIASCADGMPRVTFRIRKPDSYLALHIERFEGVPSSREYSMRFQMNTVRPVSLIELDYMTEARVAGGSEGSLYQATVDWNHIWNRNPENPKGGFAIFLSENDADHDETILKVWVNEGLPHPRVEGDWNLEAARAWIGRWLAEHGDQSRFWIAARSTDELYAAVTYAEKSGVRDVYLFTDTWRGGDAEPFWAITQLNWGINRKVFPRGEEDLRAFSDYLHERNMNLKLHWISGGIGLRDPQYVGKSPDNRLAVWGRGRLVGNTAAQDATLYFRPEPGVAMPFRLPAAEWWLRYTCPPALHNVFDYEFMVVGDELIKVGEFTDTDKDVWSLKKCLRGFSTTEAVAHEEGENMRGLVSAYGQQFLPENDSRLLDEMARNFAGMLNRCRIGNVEYDGAEIHTYNGRMWGYHKFASMVYSYLDHPVTAYSSSGMAPPCNMEYRLNATKNTWRDRQKGIVAILTDQPFRPASNVLDAHWGMSQMCARGYTIYNIMKPEPLFGVTVKTLQAHGQTDQLLETAHNWKRVNQLITPEQRERIRKTMYYADDVCEQAGNHDKSGLVHVLTKEKGQWEIHPTCVLVRPGREDTVWHDGQEHGAISPRQFVKPGEVLRLSNPFKMQQPRMVLRVLWGFDYAGIAAKAQRGSGADMRGSDSAFDYARMLLTKGGSGGQSGNILLQPVVDEIRNRRDTRFSVDGAVLVIEANNPLDQRVVNEHNLPEWSRILDMTNRRGVGMWVTGDGSGAILTLQIPGGDYVVPLNFTGRRYIEIPNAQVAWSTGCWGWRMGSKRTYYDQVTWLKLGFGVLPPRTKARVGVEGLTSLCEIATELRNPVLHVGDTKLTIKGNVASGQYLTWDGGPTCAVYDANWNRVAELLVAAEGFLAPTGEFDCRISADEGASAPWLELQLMTRDFPMIIPDPKL